jgi:16S rRNA G966 N2-methylase RsmD
MGEPGNSDTGNRLYYGGNLDILRRYVADESVDLVYLDPPFNSNADYAPFAEQEVYAQIGLDVSARSC